MLRVCSLLSSLSGEEENTVTSEKERERSPFSSLDILDWMFITYEGEASDALYTCTSIPIASDLQATNSSQVI